SWWWRGRERFSGSFHNLSTSLHSLPAAKASTLSSKTRLKASAKSSTASTTIYRNRPSTWLERSKKQSLRERRLPNSNNTRRKEKGKRQNAFLISPNFFLLPFTLC